jgi:uncharacterized protein
MTCRSSNLELGASLGFGAWDLGFLRRRVALAVLIFCFALTAEALAAEVMPPKPDRYFNDYAGVVQKDVALQLNEKLAQFERDTSVQLVVAVFRKMESDSSIDDYTRRIAKAWDIGQKETRNGAALFVFIEDRKMFIQTAYGLEGALPDATCFDITHNVIAPAFKGGNYAGGLSAGIDAMMQAVRGEYKGTGKTALESRSRNSGDGSPFLLLILFIFFMIMISRAARKKGYGYSRQGPFVGPYFGGWGGSGGGGGGWSSGGGGGFSGLSGGGGGGGFGGGGAGSSW